MVPEKYRSKCFIGLIVLFVTAATSHSLYGQHYIPGRTNGFVFGVSTGFGYATSNTGSDNHIPGIIYAGTLGFRFSERFKMDFGPSVWVEADDIFSNEVTSGQQPADKRMIIALNGYYYPFRNCGLNFRLGGGIGNLVYTHDDGVIAADNRRAGEAEYYSGFSVTSAINYEFRISPKIVFFPGINFSYTSLKEPDIYYKSDIDTGIPCLLTDLRCNFYLDF